MHPDLEAIVAADEECRSRLTLAESRHERALADARAQRDAAIEERRTAANDEIERELAAIRAEGDARVAEIREKQKTYLASLVKAGEEKFGAAIEEYLAIVGGTERQ